MYFRRLIIRNVLCHEYLDQTLERGLIGIFGHNGSGKSTFLNLMYTVLTNDWSRFPGVKSDCIRNTSDKNEEAYVYGEVVHDEYVMKIRRGLRKPAKSELQVNDEEPITDSNKIAERIEEIIGLNATMLDLFVFKQQDKIYDIFVATDAKRREAFQALNRTEKCLKIYDALGDQLAKDQEALAGFVDNSDELLASRQGAEDAISRLKEEVEAQSKLTLNETSFASATKILEDWRAKQQLLRDIATAEEALPTLAAAVDAADAKERKVLDAIANGEAYLKQDRAAYTAAQAALTQFEQYEKNRKRRKALETEKNELAVETAELLTPEEPKDYTKYDEKKAAALKTGLENELKAAKTTLADFDISGVSKCETCGTVLQRANPAVMEKNKLIVANNPPEIKKLKDWLEAIARYDAEVREYNSAKKDLDTRRKANEAALAAFDELKEPKGTKVELQELVDGYEQVEADLETSRKDQKAVVDAAAAARAKRAAKKQVIADLDAKHDALTVTKEKFDRAKIRMAEHDEARDKAAELRGELRMKETRLTEIAESLEAVKAKAKRLKKLKRTIAILERAREVTHRNGLPTRVAQTNLARLEGYVNDELDTFGSPFWVETGEDLQFIVHKPGEPPQAAPWLSTGQKCVLAGAFWMTLVTAWTDGGMLGLDEPTANLDEENRAFLAESLSRLTSRIRGNRQVIMVSHAEELRSSFDQVIDLGKSHVERQAG